jgi:hypothetical protein
LNPSLTARVRPLKFLPWMLAAYALAATISAPNVYLLAQEKGTKRVRAEQEQRDTPEQDGRQKAPTSTGDGGACCCVGALATTVVIVAVVFLGVLHIAVLFCVLAVFILKLFKRQR